jgi:hypothetical protein
MFLTTLKSQTKKRKAIAAGCVRCLFGGTCACQDEKINSIDKKEKEKREKKKKVGIGNSFVLQEQGCNTGRIFLKAQKVENHGGWVGSNKQPFPNQDGECPKTTGS